jgi:ABC-type lipoprotein release transport system permease subunit
VVSLLHGVATWDPLVLTAVIVLLNVVAMLSTLVSARRATSVHPTEALRHR